MTETGVMGVKNPRFTIENPGELAQLEADWLKKHKGLDVTPAQVRGVLMWHGEFQRSPEREAQRQAARQERLAEEARRTQERLDRKAQEKAKKEQAEAEKAKKDAEKEAGAPAGEVADKPAEPGNGGESKPSPVKRTSKLGATKAKTPAAANAEF